MVPDSHSDSVLLAFVDDLLPEPQMIEIEQRLRGDKDLNDRLSRILEGRHRGVHSLGDIWRRYRMSCPAREELGSYLLNALVDEQAAYIRFHLEVIGCRYCQSNLDDLNRNQAGEPTDSVRRRQKYLHSSIDRLPS